MVKKTAMRNIATWNTVSRERDAKRRERLVRNVVAEKVKKRKNRWRKEKDTSTKK